MGKRAAAKRVQRVQRRELPPKHPTLKRIVSQAEFDEWGKLEYWAHYQACCLACGYQPPETWEEFRRELPTYPRRVRDVWDKIIASIEDGSLPIAGELRSDLH